MISVTATIAKLLLGAIIFMACLGLVAAQIIKDIYAAQAAKKITPFMGQSGTEAEPASNL